MIAVDTNVLVHAHRADSAWHDPARAALASLANGAALWAIPWPCLHEFIAVVTHPKIFSPPTPLARALEQVEAWLESPMLTLLGESPSYWATFRAMAVNGKIAGPLVHDGRVAAMCANHGVAELWTADRDFSRFPGLLVRNPLVR
ncbi:MAG: TA system VapC family ribonuclease toxin [Gemmatimonadaceae bacterium]|nr:TA system VapC family ribonuclease toxin [Gemmatimonadaceae bacterium]